MELWAEMASAPHRCPAQCRELGSGGPGKTGCQTVGQVDVLPRAARGYDARPRQRQ